MKKLPPYKLIYLVVKTSSQGSFKNGVVAVQQAPCLNVKMLILQAFSEHFKILPWQTNSIFIIIKFPPKMPRFAVFWRDFRGLLFLWKLLKM